MKQKSSSLRNPGPPGSYQMLCLAKRVLPASLFRFFLKLGARIALAKMKEQREHSRSYLKEILKRDPTYQELFQHFFTFTESLMFKLQVGQGTLPKITGTDAPEVAEFMALAKSDRPTLFGTFHVGDSDVLGCMLSHFGRQIRMVRQRVGNSHDLERLESTFGQWLKFIWVNEPEAMLFTLKNELQDGASLAMQCDRIEFGSRQHSFDFLGKKRVFPVTIYYLAYLFKMPVVFALGISEAKEQTRLYASPVYEPKPDEKKAEALNRGFEHFQLTLNMLEKRLQENPYIWFNFLPLNPASDDSHNHI